MKQNPVRLLVLVIRCSMISGLVFLGGCGDDNTVNTPSASTTSTTAAGATTTVAVTTTTVKAPSTSTAAGATTTASVTTTTTATGATTTAATTTSTKAATTTTAAVTTTTSATTTTSTTTTTTAPASSGIAAKDMVGTWDYTLDMYADITGACKVAPTVTYHMVCTEIYAADCTITSTCTATLNGITTPIPSTTAKGCTDPNNAAVPPKDPTDTCNTQFATVTNSTNPLSVTTTGKIGGATYLIVNMKKKN